MTGVELGPRMARGLVTLLGSRGLVLGLQFVSIGLLASYLEPAGLGIYSFGLAAASVFRIIPNFGLIPVVTRDISQHPERESALLPNLIYMRVSLGVLAYGLLAVSVLALGFSPENSQAALIAGVVLLIAIDAFRSSIEVRLRVGWISIADTVEAILTVLGTLALMNAGVGVEPFLWFYVGLKLLNATIVMVAALRMTRFDWTPRRHLWAPVLRAAVPLGLAGVFMALYYRLDVVLLAGFKPPADVGQYGAAYRFLDAFAVLPTITMSVLAPVLSRSVAEGAAVLQRRYGHVVHVVSVAGLLVALVGGATAWRVLPLLPGFGRYEGAGVALSILAPAGALIFLGTVVQGALISAHLQRRLLTISAIGLAFNVALNLALIPPFSYIGAAAATTATEVLLLALSLREARKALGLRWPADRIHQLVKVAAVTTVVLGAGFFVHPFLQVAFAVLVYVTLLPVLGTLTLRDVQPFLPSGEDYVLVVSRAATPSGAPDLATAERLVSVTGSPLALWQEVRGAGTCEVQVAGDRPVWLLLVIGLAGCREIVLVEQDASGLSRRGWLDDRLTAALVERVVVRSEEERDQLARRRPRTAQRAVARTSTGSAS